MYINSYCKVHDFHPGLNIPKILVFRSFQQDSEEITSSDHFIQEHVSFFDQVTMVQMKDAAMRVLYRGSLGRAFYARAEIYNRYPY